METIKIDNTDIILQDFGGGKGKIIVSDTYGYNFSHFWGSMGSSLKEFILQINEGYFSMKLTPAGEKGVFDGIRTVRNIRKSIKSDYSYELPWYKYMPLQKELREKLKDLETAFDERDFVDLASNIPKDLWLEDSTRIEEKEFIEIMESLFMEPWHFIEYGPSQNTIFLKDLLPKLKKQISLNL